jgi:DNA-binding HxlR family transcriptional regulator
VELALEFVGGKWKTVILAYLKESPQRFGELRARLPNVSDKILAERLKDLEQLGLIEKVGRTQGRSTHTYHLTRRGASLRPVLDQLYAWGAAMADELPVSFGVPRASVGHRSMAVASRQSKSDAMLID